MCASDHAAYLSTPPIECQSRSPSFFADGNGSDTVRVKQPMHVSLFLLAPLLTTTVPSDCLEGSARCVTAFKDKQPEGIKLFSLKPQALAARCGFENGDVVLSVTDESSKIVNANDLDALAVAMKRACLGAGEISLERRGESKRIRVPKS
jgi:hypothetical protein